MKKNNKLVFKKNDLVKIVNDDHVYICYSQFIKRHLQYAIRWAYRAYPNTGHIFRVKGVYNHCRKDKYDKNKKCIVIEDQTNHQIFLIGELGIKEIEYEEF